MYAFILTRSTFGLSFIIFGWDCCLSIFTIFELQSLIDGRILFLLNIFRTNGQNLTKLVPYALICTRSRLGFLLVIFFFHFVTELQPQIDICNRVKTID